MPCHRVLHHQPVPAQRQERTVPDIRALLKAPLSEGAIEVHLTPGGAIDWLLSAPSTQALSGFSTAVERVFPGSGVFPDPVPCALPGHPASHWTFAWARQRTRHWKPLDITEEHDYADGIVSALSSSLARGREVVVQVLFRAVGGWEEKMHLLTAPREKLLMYHQGYDVSLTGSVTKRTPTQWDQQQYTALTGRLQEPAYHVEVRVAADGPEAEAVLRHCIEEPYLKQFLGGKWRNLEFVKDKEKVAFDQAFRSHSFSAFANDRERRDVSRSELAYLLCPPWSRPHASLHYYVEEQEVASLRRALTAKGPTTSPPVSRVGLDSRSRGEPIQSPSVGPAAVSGNPPSRPCPEAVPKFLPMGLPGASPYWVAMGKTFQGDPVFLSENPPWNHAAVLGATGTGKSTLLLQWALEILLKRPGWSVILIDPHGTLAESLKALLPPDIAADTIELDPSRLTFDEDGVEMVSLPLNILSLPDLKGMDTAAFTSARDIIVDNLVYFVKTIWGPEVFGPQMDHNISSLASGLLEIPGANLVDMYYVMTNPQARARFARLVKSEGIRRFVEDELPRLTNVRYSQDRISSTLNRLGKITNNPLLRLTLCQRVNPVDFRTLLDHRLVIINLSKTRIGNEASRFLGAMCFARLWLAVLQRGVTGRQTCLFVDEFQNFVTPSIAHILTEARKFGLHLVMANQYLEQVPEEIRSAVVANTDTWVFFRMGVEDSRRVADISRPGRRGWTEETIRSLPPHRAVLVQGNRLEMITTYPPMKPTGNPEGIDAAVTVSTRRYTAEETSEASPFLVDNEVLGPVAYAVSEGTTLRKEIAKELGISPGEVFAALRRGEDLGYITWDPKTKENRVTELGRTFVDVWGARRVTESEGDLHMDLLARAVEHIRTAWKTEAHITPQGANPRPLPDATFEKDGIPCNVEVECSTLATKAPQVVKNLRKAREEGRRCLFVVQSVDLAERLVQVVEPLSPGAKLAADFAILYWADGRPSVLPKGISSDGFPFTPVVEEKTSLDSSETSPALASGLPETSNAKLHLKAPDLVIVREAVSSLVTQGKLRATSEEILEATPKRERSRFTSGKTGKLTTKLGTLLSQLGVPSEKVWVRERNNTVRFYRLDEIPPGNGEPLPQDTAEPTGSGEA